MSIYQAMAISFLSIVALFLFGWAIIWWIKFCGDNIERENIVVILAIAPVAILLWIALSLRMAGLI